MPLFLFFLFVAFPALEIYVLVQVIQAIGFGWTLLLLVLAGFVGSVVMRRAGAAWWRALRGAGQPDGRAAAASALLFLAGFLLLLPGFLSDLVGLLLLLPPVRALLQTATAAWFVRRFSAVTGPGGVGIWSRPSKTVRGTVIRVDREPPPNAPTLPPAE